jgi:hypothetical protein
MGAKLPIEVMPVDTSDSTDPSILQLAMDANEKLQRRPYSDMGEALSFIAKKLSGAAATSGVEGQHMKTAEYDKVEDYDMADQTSNDDGFDAWEEEVVDDYGGVLKLAEEMKR